MSIRLNGSVFLGEFELVLAQNLAVRKVWISKFALLGEVGILVEEVELVDVSGGELSGVDVEVSEESSSFPKSDDKARADV